MRISDWSSDVCSSDLTGGEPVERLRTWLALSPEPAFGIPIGAAVPADQRSAHHRGDRGEDDGSDVSTGRRLYQMRRLAGGSDSGRGGAGGPLCDSRSQGTRAVGGNGGSQDGKSVVEGKRGAVRVDLGGSRIIN